MTNAQNILLWIIILLRQENVLCFTTATRYSSPPAGANGDGGVANEPPNTSFLLPPDSAGFHQQQSTNVDANNDGRSVYDPGDEIFNALNSDDSDEFVDRVMNDMELPEQYGIMKQLEDDIREEQDIAAKSALLIKMLEDPKIDSLPVVYIEESPLEENSVFPAATMDKRSRYYRRFPWKRHSRNRGSYEPEIRYACTPSREDVFKLLIGLHENRNGNQHKTVNFCNRKRPAKAIFTNIRFLG